MKFDPSSVKYFRFTEWHYDAASGTATFRYALGEQYTFCEKIVFNGAKQNLTEQERQALFNALAYLHIMLGISYYKAAVTERIEIAAGDLSEHAAEFFNKIYIKGLGEFSQINKISIKSRINFPVNTKLALSPSNLELPRKTVVPIGGGKDSLVTLELLRKVEKNISLLVLGEHPALLRVAASCELPIIQISRMIDRALIELNSKGAYNGHVPFSAMLAFIFPVAAILYGFDTVVLSQERSANVGNLTFDGMEVNHQYSKSYEFENDFLHFLNTAILKNLRYFSLLRPFSELHIAKLFCKQKRYFPLFTSCNGNFKISDQYARALWCNNCPKCRFVYLMLAPFLDKATLTSIFHRDLFDDLNQLEGYKELLGVSGFKPFECVGEVDECKAAFSIAFSKDDWKDSPLLSLLANEGILKNIDTRNLISSVFSLSPENAIPDHYKHLIYENVRSSQ